MTNVSRRITLKKNYILALFAGLLFLSFVFVNVGSGHLRDQMGGRQRLDSCHAYDLEDIFKI